MVFIEMDFEPIDPGEFWKILEKKPNSNHRNILKLLKEHIYKFELTFN